MERRCHTFRSRKTIIPEMVEKDKASFFEEVFTKCQYEMESKVSEFFFKYIVSKKYGWQQNMLDEKKSLRQAQNIPEDVLNCIKPNIFLQNRTSPFIAKQRIQREQKQNNQRIVSTPKTRKQKRLEYRDYKQFVMAKKMSQLQYRMKTQTNTTETIYNWCGKSGKPKICLSKPKYVKNRFYKKQEWSSKNTCIPNSIIAMIKVPHAAMCRREGILSLRKSTT